MPQPSKVTVINKDQGVVPVSFVEALIDLMGSRSRQDLIACLMAHLSKLKDVEQVVVYELCNENNDSVFNADNVQSAQIRSMLSGEGDGEAIDKHPEYIQSVLSKSSALSNKQGRQQFIVPVLGNRDVIGLIVVSGKSFSDDMRFRIEAMTNIWNRHLCLIDKNERDILTGLYNRYALESMFPRILHDLIEQKQSRRRDNTTTKVLAMFDIDHFKEVNDRFGHLYGDEVIVHFARLMMRSFRFYDYLFRYGGEEFVVILSDVDTNTAEAVLERFRQAVENYDFPQIGRKTVSIGMIEINTQDLPTTMLDKADKALYYAKQHGRNRVFVYEKLVESGALSVSQDTGDIELF